MYVHLEYADMKDFKAIPLNSKSFPLQIVKKVKKVVESVKISDKIDDLIQICHAEVTSKKALFS